MASGEDRMLLLVDDEPAQLRLVSALAARAGWRTAVAADVAAAMALLEDGRQMADAVLVDLWRPGEAAAAQIGELHRRFPELPIVVLTAQASVALAVEAMRAGASDFLLKPLTPARLFAALEAARAGSGSAGELRPLAEKTPEALGLGEIVGSTPAFRAALALAAKAARARVPVIVQGEPGSGRETIAEAIHAASGRGRRAPVSVDCAVLSPAAAEAELFGHERGAFPGAFQSQLGRIGLAEGSTLILKDMAALPQAALASLARMVETGMAMPLGGRIARTADVRLIATGAPGADAGALAPFAQLGAIVIAMPSLRERAADIPALARHLLGRISVRPGMRPLGLTDEALALLAAHDWPGNVRQLHNVLFRAAINATGDALTPADFPQVARAAGDGPQRLAERTAGVELFGADDHIRPLADIEADIIRLAIGHYHGRMSEVARRLGIGRSTLYRKLAELGLDNVA